MLNRTLWSLWPSDALFVARERLTWYLTQEDEWVQQADVTVRRRLGRQRFEVQSILNGSLPEPNGTEALSVYDFKPRTWFELGALWSEREHYEHALAAFFNAGDSDAVHLHVASILAAWGDTDLALPLFQQVVDPDLAFFAKLHSLMAVPPVGDFDRATLRRELRELAESGLQTTIENLAGKTFFHLAHQCENEVREFELLGAALRRVAPELVARPPLARRATKLPTVGFASAHLSDHSIGKMLAELLAHLAKRLEVVVFHIGMKADDAVRAFLENKVSVVLLERSLVKMRAAILQKNLDILVYPDVGMEPWSYLLAFSRLARVQCVWWGHPVTTGLPTIDYYLSLDTEIHDADQHYAEQLVRVDLVNTAPFAQVLSLSERLGDTLKPRSELIPTDDPGGALYLVLGRLFKLHPLFDDVLFRILERDPTGLILLVAEPQPRVTNALYRRLQAQNRTLERIRFVDYWNYVQALARATVVLDTYPYGGCLTALDAMSNSKPFVTLPGAFERGRFAMSIYAQMNLTDYVATDVDHFLDLAVTLGTDPAANAHAVRRIAAAYPRAHQPARLADEWAALFRRMHHTAI